MFGTEVEVTGPAAFLPKLAQEFGHGMMRLRRA